MGLEFEVTHDPDGKPITYSIDTDLYPIARPEYAEFAVGIEDDIVAFVESLAGGRIKLGTIRGRTALIVPTDTGCALVVRRRLVTIRTSYRDIRKAEARGTFVVLDRS